jgi:FolB domain-containing protein
MDKVFIRNLCVVGILGVNDWEREKPRDIIINVTMITYPHPGPQTDNISECVDYSKAAKDIRALVEKARRFTVEALADDIACLCLKFPEVQRVVVAVEKPGAVTDAESVGVEIERKKLNL